MISREKALRIARDWIDSWNRHDLDSIMSHYSEDVELISPIVIKLLGDESAKVTGRDALREYFKKGLAAYPDLRFETIDVFTGVDSLVLYYRRHNGPPGAELMVLNQEDKITRVIAHYSYAE
ncbi:MAG TPA: nuclear transport factor 2 family protein [Thermodesulfobacteriota bacterium]|nr:nuclear transport factor 2 family protein [Thermodesulfobacteriota bacterium]